MPLAVNNIRNNVNFEKENATNIKSKKGLKLRNVLGDISNKNKNVITSPSIPTKIKQGLRRVSRTRQKKKLGPRERLEKKFGKNDKLPIDPVDLEATGELTGSSVKYVPDYISDVIKMYRKEEEVEDMLVNFDYMNDQSDLNEKMRELLVDWLNQVHYRFKLSTACLYLAISLLDRFLSRAQVKRDKLQLVGCCTLWMAAKYEEIYAPEVSDFVTISDESFTFNDMVKAEKYILDSLNFKVGFPTLFIFLRRYMRVLGCSVRLQFIAGYVAELSLQKMEFLKYNNTDLAAYILYYSILVLDYNLSENKENIYGDEFGEAGEFLWDEDIERISECKGEDMYDSELLKELKKAVVGNHSSNNKAVTLKYEGEKYMTVSKLDYDVDVAGEQMEMDE